MKIRKLSLENIHSLKGKQSIDFAGGILGTAGLFAITGPTGSGKSTILDAITLALYNRIPRIDKQITVSVIEEEGVIITKNALDCFAEVEYEVKGKIYNSVLPLFKAAAELKHIELKDAFDCELDLSNSILHCDIEEAYNRGMDFYISWYLFNNNVIDEVDRSYIKDYRYDLFHRDWNPMQMVA